MKRGDEMPGGLVVNSVESARMSNDRTVVAVDRRRPARPRSTACTLRKTNGQFDLILDQAQIARAGPSR